MGEWHVDGTSTPGLLKIRLEGTLSTAEMRAFVDAHNAAIDALKGAEYHVWVDLRKLLPLGPEATELMEVAKRHSVSNPSFRGSAVHVASATVAMQHKRTTMAVGATDTELISEDETVLRAHIAHVRRSA
jgi:hypothetical protein